MVALTRELVNTLISITTKATILDPMVLNNYNMDMDIDTPRERSVSSSTNSLRAFSVHSNTSSIPYHKRMEIQSNNLPWSEQCYNSKPLELDYEVTLYWVTQENLIESSLQNSLPYILLQMVCVRYCASYPK